MDEQADQKWQRRPVLSTLARIIAHGLPIVAGVGIALAISAAMSDVNALARTAVASLAGAVAFVVTGRYSRRLLPLSMLLDLSMQFPDEAPSRFKMALRSGTVKKLNDWAADRYAPGSPNQIGVNDALTLVAALNAHDRRTRGHSERVRALSDLMAERLELSDEEAYKLRWAALLHDIGKLDVPEEILNKPGAPSDAEWDALQAHPDAGTKFASVLEPWMGEWIHAIDCHHERYDGDGYPRGMAGTEIPLAARIVAVTDSYETMTSARSYKKAMNATAAREELVRCAGHHFDPVMVRTFLEISLPRLRWAMGPVAALAHIPLVGPVAQLVTNAGASAVVPSAASAQVSAAAAMVLSGGVVASSVEPTPAPPPPPAQQQADIAALGNLDLTTLTVSGQTIVLAEPEIAPAEVEVTAAPDAVELAAPAPAPPAQPADNEVPETAPETVEPPAAPAAPAVPAADAPARATTAPAEPAPPPPPEPPPVDPADDEDEWDDAKHAAKDAREAMKDAESDAEKAAHDAEAAAEKWAETAEELAEAEDDGDVNKARDEAEDALEKAVKAAEHAADAQAHAAEAATLAQTAVAAATDIADPELRAEADVFAADAAFFAAAATDHAGAAQASALEARGHADRAVGLVEAFVIVDD